MRSTKAMLFWGVCFGLISVAWATSFGTLAPADFTFANNTEIKSVDPHVVTGQPEGRVIYAIYEGLYGYAPEDLAPVPGVAESHTLSPDQKTYAFRIRPTAKWSNGDPVTAHDFVWSWKRVLHPETAAEYGYQLDYLKNASKFHYSKLAVGDPVEVEIGPRRFENEPFPQAVLIQGTLRKIEGEGEAAVYTVEELGLERKFSKKPAAKDVEPCRSILFDFAHVGVHAVDDRTLVVELENPTPYFLKLCGFYTLFPVHRKSFEGLGSPAWKEPKNLVSNGPFTILFRRIRDRIRMVKNPLYWNAEKVKLNSVDVLAVSSELTSLNMYLAGQIDWTPDIPVTVLDELKKRPDVHSAPRLSVLFVRINTLKKPLDDVRVRRALAAAVNKKDVTLVTRGGETPARNLVPPGIAGYTPPQGPEFDLAAAKKLLAEAGYPDGAGLPTIEYLYNTRDTNKDVAELLQNQWRKLGVSVRIQNMEWGTYLDHCQKGQYEIARAGWIGDYADPNTFLDMFVTGNPNNQTGWSNARYDELIRLAAAESDPQNRFGMLAEAEGLLIDESPIIPVYFQTTNQLVRPYVKGIYTNLLQTHPLNEVEIDFDLKRKTLDDGF